ncbi:hypothetical protein KY358_03200 [Candidatus Woesearchaeota archaeon]|nr:hypothetical protein [Candidatus Woesearchaeota archaeon]
MNNIKTYRGVKKSKIFIKEVVRFLMILENNYGSLVSIDILKKEFKDYNRIISYLYTDREKEDELIGGNGKGWKIHAWNLDKIQELISRSVNEDLVYEQKECIKKQKRFNRLIALTGSIIAFVTLWNFFEEFLNKDFSVELIAFILIVILVIFLFFMLAKESFGIYLED